MYNPRAAGLLRHIEVQDFAPIMRDDEEAMQKAKGQ